MQLRKWLQPIAGRILKPLARIYLGKVRRSRYQDVDVVVPPGVFHPGFYLSTRFMLRHLAQHALAGQQLWEIGAGSGMVAIWCAKRGAIVTASDISIVATAAITANALRNVVVVQVVLADLFEGMPTRCYDWIVINPPYYPRNPQTESENAFYCGEEYQYFERLYAGLEAVCTTETQLRMVLSEDCNLERIAMIGSKYGWQMREVDRMRKLGEWNFIFALEHQGGGA
jgi:release factor glutamine methyltransferase